jgi:Vitamin K-dependent gamma-carboxylase
MGTATDQFKNFIYQPVSVYPLAGFRILYGLLLMASTVRFWYNGWIEKMYIDPQLFFPWPGFEWIQPLYGKAMYLPFVAMFVASIGIALGRYYRGSCALFFVCFTYVELIDRTNYLNHYYFISLLTFLLFIVPANEACVWRRKNKTTTTPRFYLLILQGQILLVYFFAGIAKLESSWLLDAMPLKLWLPAHAQLPWIGSIMHYPETAYIFSWCGCLYDLFIPFFLCHPRTKIGAFIGVIIFHVVTSILFPIGVFPYVMIASAAIFLPASWFEKALGAKTQLAIESTPTLKINKRFAGFLMLYFSIQVLMPFRYVLYPGHLLWTEQGYRFSWRVMLNEKAGTALFYAKDQNGKVRHFENSKYLTAMQEKQMSFQPDMLVTYAQHLKKQALAEGLIAPTIHGIVYVAWNGRPSQKLVNENEDMSSLSNSMWVNQKWILPSP